MVENRRVTIHDVAEEAGISRQTVSRVINNRPDVAPDTRKRVEEIIQRLGYQPSAIARSLSQRRSFTLGVATAGLKHVGPSRTLNGVAQQAEKLGYGLLLKELLSFDTNDTSPLLQWFLARQVDGILWAVPEVGENRKWLGEQLPELPVPLILMTMGYREGFPIVSVDNYHGGRLAVEHLVQTGHRHIAHISGPLDWWEARQRKQGWQDVLQEAGFSAAERFCVEGNWAPGSGERAIRKLLSEYKEMDAVFVANDQMALSVIQVACSEGINIPNDLALVGFDGVPESAYYWPPLTTVFQDQQALGMTAVNEAVRLIDEMRKSDLSMTPKQIFIKPELILRESSGGLSS